MSTIILPNTDLFCPGDFLIQIRGNILVNVSPMNGSTQTVEMPGDRIVFTLMYGPHHSSDIAALRAFWLRFRGQAHVLRLWNLAQPIPLGTLRGSPVLESAAVEGANSVVISGTGGSTLNVGDWIGITLSTSDLQTVEVVESSGTGTITVGINPPLRRSAADGATVVWQRPWVDCLLTSPPTIPHGKGSANQMGISDGFTIEAAEFVP